MVTKKELKKAPLEIVFILDKSGSMQHLKKTAIDGYNKFIQDQKESNPDAVITTVLFDDKVTFLQRRASVRNAKLLDTETYNPDGWTALDDAIGLSIAGLNFLNPEKAVIAILTDGQENSSKIFERDEVKSLLQDAQKKDWATLYLAANQDAFAVSNNYGIAKQFVSNFANNAFGLSGAINTVSDYTNKYRSTNTSNIASVASLYASNTDAIKK